MVANRLANSILPSSPKIWQTNPPFAVTIQFKVGVLNEQNLEVFFSPCLAHIKVFTFQ